MKIGFIGTGNMGGAILRGYAKSPASEGNEILIHNRTTEHNEAMAAAISGACVNRNVNIRVCNNNAELAQQSDVIIIGVKPDGVADVLREIAPAGERIIVSMAAGVTIAEMEQADSNAKIIRIMPNTPAMAGEAMTSASRNEKVTDEDYGKVRSILEAVGKCEEVPEDLIDCVIGVSGSSTAYTYMYIEALVQAAEENGMQPEKARKFAAQAVYGAAKMVMESRESLEQLRMNVCSPGGTTIEAVNTLLKNGFMQDIKEGFQAAVDRSKEMSGK